MKGLKLSQWVGIALGAMCGLLMVWMVAQRFGFGQGYTPLEELTEPLDMALLAPLKQSRHALPPDTHFAEVQQRPLFNNDRKPTVIKSSTPAAPPDQPVVALNANLTGTVVANGRHMALVRDNTTSKVVVLKPGMTMPGELAGWKLVSVDQRAAVFDGGPGAGLVELKLDVSKTTGPAPTPPPVANTTTPGASPVPPPQPGQQPPQPAVAQAPPTPADQAAKEAEVRRIIEERRAQMRAEAAKMGGN